RANSIDVGTLRQCVGVTQAVDVLFFEAEASIIIAIAHSPGSQYRTSTKRSAYTKGVQVGISIISKARSRTRGTNQTILLLAETSVQLDHFEVIAQAQVPLLGFTINTGSNTRITGKRASSISINLIVSQSS